MENYTRCWLKCMKWLLVFFAPIACICMLALPIWTSLYPWDEAKVKLNEKYPDNGSSNMDYQLTDAESAAQDLLNGTVFGPE